MPPMPPMPEPISTPVAICSSWTCGFQPESSQRLRGGRHRVDDERIDLALVLGLHPLVGVEGAVGAVAARDLAGDLAGEIVDLEALRSGARRSGLR